MSVLSLQAGEFYGLLIPSVGVRVERILGHEPLDEAIHAPALPIVEPESARKGYVDLENVQKGSASREMPLFLLLLFFSCN